MKPLLHERVVLITGAAGEGNIGEAVARAVHEHGGTPLVTSRRAEAAEAAARRIGPRAAGYALDLTDEADVQGFARRALQAHGHVDAVVHNAGHPVTEWARDFLDVPSAEYARVFDVDVMGGIRLTKALLPSMLARGSGSLVFTSSTAALGGYRYLHEFAPAKAAVLGLMKGLAAEHGRNGVRSNAVAYGNVGTPATLNSLTPEQQAALAAEAPLGRWGTPAEAAGAVLFLVSDLASFVNGQTLVVDGGTLMR